MEKLLALLCFLVAVSLSRGALSRAPCETTSCPEYTLIEDHTSFQKRSYESTRWLTTSISSNSVGDLMAANSRLNQFCSDNDQQVLKSSWPAFITVNSNGSYWLSWFVPKEVTVTTPIQDPLITLQNTDYFEVYVRSFGGTPSLQSGQMNAQQLWDNLKTHLGKNCSIPTFSGATYNPYLSMVHNNEIWIRVNDIC